MGPFFYSIYLNDLSIDLVSTVTFFTDDVSQFSTDSEVKTSSYELNKNLEKLAESVHKWKISFNPDLNMTFSTFSYYDK